MGISPSGSGGPVILPSQQGVAPGARIPTTATPAATDPDVSSMDHEPSNVSAPNAQARPTGLLDANPGVALNLSAAHQSQMKLIAAALHGGSAGSELQSRWGAFVSDVVAAQGAIDPNALVQAVLRESYLQTTEDLRFYAEKVKFFNELKKQIREELTAARNELAKHAGKEGTEPVTYSEGQFVFEFTGQTEPTAVTRGAAIETKEQLETSIKNMEEKLNSVGDDAQLANVDLQNILQKQQQTLQMVSNISKLLHDTALAIIRKIGG